MCQTLTLSVSQSCQTDDLVTNSIEAGVLIGTGSSFLKYIVDKSLSLRLHIRCSLNYRGENNITVTNPRRLGLMDVDVDPVIATFTQSGKCTVLVPFRSTKVTQLIQQDQEDSSINYDLINDILDFVSMENLKYCPGIKSNQDLANGPSFKAFEDPFPRVQSKLCHVLFKSSNRNKIGQCESCLKASKVLTNKRKRNSQVTPSIKAKRCKTDSKCPISSLTPISRRRRLLNIKQSRRSLTERMSMLEAQLEHKDLLLNVDQSNEVQNMIDTLKSDFQDDVDEAIKSSEDNEKLLRMAWERDTRKIKEDKLAFYTDQKKCEEGSTGNRWSPITIRIALAVFSRSKAAYHALKSLNILKLPAANTLKKRSEVYDNSPGVNHKYLMEQKLKYDQISKEKEEKGQLIPQGDGVLIFDEVKVIEKLIWNSKNHQFLGFAMEESEFPLLKDISTGISEPSPTQYVLQFLWRDLTSGFDLIGPYYTFSSSVVGSKLLPCILEVLRVLNSYGFQTSVIMCDGASSNLATIKKTLGGNKMFEYTLSDAGNQYEVKPYFEHPFIPNRKIFWVICPSHELKSLINGLSSSQPNKTKSFERNNTPFGWNEIKSLFCREIERQNQGLIRYIPKMHASYVIRDAWTKLNVKPAKIMQQPQVLSELYAFAHDESVPDYGARERALECYNYLTACSQIFENGFLTKERVFSPSDKAMESIKTGYSYFSDWLTEILSKNPKVKLLAPKQRNFLSWQTWDLLRITVFGFCGFVEDFLARHPGNFISPIRVNGSALESLFAQLKYASGSKLSGTAYSSAQKSVRITKNIHSGSFSNTDYRDVNLDFCD